MLLNVGSMGASIWSRALNTCQIKADYSTYPAGLKWRSTTLFILTTVAIGLFTDLFLYSILVPVLPFMLEDRAGMPPDQTQTYVSAMLATYAGAAVFFSPIAGVFADKVSTRQAPFLLGLASLLGATVLLFLGRSIEVLLLARILQGMSSAVVWSIGMALVVETVGAENLGKTIGTIFSFISAGTIWAPTVGGVLYERTGFDGIIGVSLGAIGLDLIMRLFVIEKRVAQRYGLEETKSNEDESRESGSSENQQDSEESEPNERQPLLGQVEHDEDEFKIAENQSKLTKTITILPCLKNPSLLTALFLTLVQALTFGSFDATVTTVSRELFGFDSLKAGLLFLPLGVMDLVLSPLAGWSVDRYGTKPSSVISYSLMTPVLVFLRLPHAGGLDQILFYSVLLALAGICLSGEGAPSVVEAGNVVRNYHEKNKDFFGETGPYAQLFGLNSMVFSLGLTLGPELAGELKTAIGYGNMNIILAVISAIAAVLSWMYVGGKPKAIKRSR